MTRSSDTTMTQLLRRALADADSFAAVERATGVKRQSMMMFMKDGKTLRLDIAEKLAAYFGIECRFKGKR